MEDLKNSLKDISSESISLGKDYLKYASLTASKKLALLAGILLTALFFSLIFLLIIILLSLMLAGMLNELFGNEFAGFLIMTGFYLLLIGGLIYYIVKKKTPLFSSLFVRIFAFVFEIESDAPITLEHIDSEKKKILDNIETDKKQIALQFKLLKYVLIETIIREFFEAFRKDGKSNNKESEGAEESIPDTN
jgi:hypothetical protein